MKDSKCGHPKDKRKEGPRIPAVYGSWATEICKKCKSWRELGHITGKWRKDCIKIASRRNDEE